MGDFHSILKPSEKLGGNKVNNSRIRIFENVLNTCNLIDLGFSGPCFTWQNNQRGKYNIRERLDRCLANQYWMNIFPTHIIKHICCTTSDHSPIYLNTSN